MAIPYLNAGDQPLAEYWDLLWAEFDRKIAVAMDDHALPYASFHVNPILSRFHWPFGRTFCWVGTNRPYTNAFGNQYVHQPFLDAVLATAADVSSTTFSNPTYEDKIRKVVRLKQFPSSYYTAAGVAFDGSLLNSSLEAHRKNYTATGTTIPESYWVMDNRGNMPEKIYNSALADIMVEDYGSSLTIPATYNKYNFFRINNCQNIALTVSFQSNTGPGHTLIIPKYQSKCLRRTGVDGEYTEGYKYFQRVLPGDYRYAVFGTTNFTSYAISIYASSLVNNAINPFNTFQAFCALFDGSPYGPNGIGIIGDPPNRSFNRVDGPVLIRDFHVIPDALPTISGGGTYFPESISDSTILGDLLYHRGILKSIQGENADHTLKVVDVNFQGFTATDWASYGLALGTDADGSPTIARAHSWPTGASNFSDLLVHSTNLTMEQPPTSNFLTKPVADITSTPLKIYSRAPGTVIDSDGSITSYPWYYEQVIPFEPFVQSVLSPQSFDYPSTTPVSNSLSNLQSRQANRVFGAVNMRIHQSTLATLKNLNIVGNPSFNFTNQETSVCTYSDKDVVMSWGGLTLKYKTKVKQVYPIANGTGDFVSINFTPFIDRAFMNFDSGYLEVNGRVQMYGYGWATTTASALDPRNGASIGGPGHAPVFQGFCYSPRGTVPYDTLAPISFATDITNVALTPGTGRKHPYSADEPYGAQGKDISFENLGAYLDANLRLLAPFGTQQSTGQAWLAVPPKLNSDVAYGAHQLLTSASVWNANRARMIANTLAATDGIVGGLMTISRRLLLSVENYNCMATVVNQFWLAKPLNFERARITIASGYVQMFPPNKTGIFTNSSIRPAEQYATFALDSNEYKTCQALGITIRTKADFPASWTTTKSAFRRNIFIQFPSYPAEGTVVITGIEDTDDHITINEAFGTTLGEPAEYYWCKIADVKVAAIAKGFQFIFEDQTLAFKLEVATGASPSFIQNDLMGFDPTRSGSAYDSGLWTNRAVLYEISDTSDLEFVGEHRPLWAYPSHQTSIGIGQFNVQDVKEPDVETGMITVDNSSRVVTRGRFTYDMDARARALHVSGNDNYHAAYRVVGDYASDSVLYRNYSTTPRSGLAIAFPKSSAIPDADGFSSDGAHVDFKFDKDTPVGSPRQERAFSLEITLVPAPADFDPTDYTLSIPVNRGTADDQIVSFSDFIAPDIRQLSLYKFSDNYIRL